MTGSSDRTRSIGARGWLGAAAAVLAVHLALALSVPGLGWVTSAGVGAMCLLAAALCGMETRRIAPDRRWRWVLPMAAFLLWAAGYAAIAWLQSVAHADASRARLDTLLFMLRGVPWVLLLARIGDDGGGRRFRRIDAAQALLFAFVAAVLLFPRLVAGEGVALPTTDRMALTFHDIENVALAALAIVSRWVQPAAADRRFLRAPAWLLGSYAIEAFVVNHLVIARAAPLPGSAVFMLGSVPILIFIAVVLRDRTPAVAPEPEPRRSTAAETVRQLLPACLGVATLAMAFAISRTAFLPGLAAGLAALLLYAARSALAQQRFATAQTALVRARDRMELLAQVDFLTGLPNRRRFDAMIQAEWRRAARVQAPLTLLLIDIDEFKRFNDRAGHLAGDDCLRDVAQIMQRHIKREGDLLARYGGEEFVVAAPFTDLAGGMALAELLRSAVRAIDCPHPASRHGAVTVSIGVASVRPGAGPVAIAALIAAADEALYRAKAAGRNRVEGA